MNGYANDKEFDKVFFTGIDYDDYGHIAIYTNPYAENLGGFENTGYSFAAVVRSCVFPDQQTLAEVTESINAEVNEIHFERADKLVDVTDDLVHELWQRFRGEAVVIDYDPDDPNSIYPYVSDMQLAKLSEDEVRGEIVKLIQNHTQSKDEDRLIDQLAQIINH